MGGRDHQAKTLRDLATNPLLPLDAGLVLVCDMRDTAVDRACLA